MITKEQTKEGIDIADAISKLPRERKIQVYAYVRAMEDISKIEAAKEKEPA